MTKNWERKIQQKICLKSFFDKKMQFTYPQAFINDVQATGEAFSPPKRPSSTSKDEFHKLFYIFLGHFCPPGSGDPNQDSDPDPQHWKKVNFKGTYKQHGLGPSFFIHVTLGIHQWLKKNGAKKRLTAKSASRRRSESAGLGNRRQKFCRMRKVHSSPVYIPMYFTLHSKFT